jgi:pimeloyl-ACP methyl ester carboxylesterase
MGNRGASTILVVLTAMFGCGAAASLPMQGAAQTPADRGAPTELGAGFASNAAPADGTVLHYVRGGTGPAVLLLHGFPEDWYEYRKIMPELSRRFTVVAVDLPGVGGSTPSTKGYDDAAMADEIHELAERLHLGRAYVVGHDIGGMVAYAYVRRHESDVRGAMLLDAPLPGIGPWDEIMREPLVWHVGFHQAPGELAEKLVMGRQTEYFGYFLRASAFTNADVAHYASAYAKKSQLHAMFEMYRAFGADAEFNAAQRGRVDVPLVVAAGERSPFAKYLPQISGSLRANGCARVETATIAGSSHYVVEEAPVQVLELIEKNAAQ